MRVIKDHKVKMSGRIRILFLIVICLCHFLLTSQSKKTDSLLILLKQNLHDTNKVKILKDLAWEWISNDPDSSIILSSTSLKLAEKLASSPIEAVAKAGERGVGEACRSLGDFYRRKGNHQKSIDFLTRALTVWKKLNDKGKAAVTINSMGNVYCEQNNYPLALNYYMQALEMTRSVLGRSKAISEQQKLKQMMANNLSNIGVIYNDLGDYDLSLKYHTESLTLNKELGNKTRIATNLSNIGVNYFLQAEHTHSSKVSEWKRLFHLSLKYYSDALEIDKASNNKRGMASRIGNIAGIYHALAKLSHGMNKAEREQYYGFALQYYTESLEIDKELGNTYDIITDLSNIGLLYCERKQYEKSEKFLLQSLAIADGLGSQDGISFAHKNLSTLYDSLGRFQLAFEHYRKYTAAKDSIFSEEKSKDIGKLEAKHEFDKQQALAETEHKKQLELANEKEKRQQILSYTAGGGLLLVLVFAIFIFNRFRLTRRQKAIIEEQKRLVEEKQKEIIDSITYARRIQRSLLPTEKYIIKSLKGSIRNK